MGNSNLDDFFIEGYASIKNSKTVYEKLSNKEKKLITKAYFKTFSDDIIINDIDAYTSKFDTKHVVFLGNAVPDEIYKRYERNILMSENFKKAKFLDEYDNISEAAIELGYDKYKEDDFLNKDLCRVMHILDVEEQTITGWAYYATSMANQISSGKKKITVPIKARPLLSNDYKSSTVNITFASRAYLKKDFDELSKVSIFSFQKLSEREKKNIVLEIAFGKDALLMHTFKQIQDKEVLDINIFYKRDAEVYLIAIKYALGLLPQNFEFNYYPYLSDNGNRLILSTEKAFELSSRLDEMVSIFQAKSNI